MAEQTNTLFALPKGPILPALATDAACSGNPGIMEFRGMAVTGDGTGQYDPRTGAQYSTQVFHRGPFKQGTNNIGEFLALVLGLAYLKKHQLPWPLYTDSMTALAWVRKKKANTKLEWTPENQELLLMIRAAEKWLLENTYTTQIYKWDTERWGEIPADFGRK